jgi:isopropylmalate/homocitrate/citramalate synthase
MREWTSGQVPIEVHCHNDFGVAVANTLTGVMAGADVVSTTVNGLGERAGGASTQQVVAALELLYRIPTGIRLTSLTSLSRLVEEISAIPVQRYEPLVGPLTFQIESGSVVSGYLKHPLVAFPFPPELVGGKVTVILGKKSGHHSIQHKLSELGLPTLPAEAVGRLLGRVKHSAETTGSPVSDDTFAGWAAEEAATRQGSD